MRLTNSLISSNYLKRLNKNLEEFNEVSEKVAAERQFLNVSEDPATAMKAFQIRKSLQRNSVYSSNLSSASGLLTEAENTVSIINDVVSQDAIEQISKGITGTSDNQAVRKTVADSLRSLQSTILNTANAQYSGDFIFGGATSEVKPFTVDDDGNLLYKGQNVDTGTFKTEHKYIDVGIGLTVETDGTVSRNSAMDIAFSGAELLGTGVDSDGITNNVYNLLGDIADKLESGDLDDINKYSQKFNTLAGNVRLQYVSIGEKSNFITYFNDRLESQKLSDSKRQTELEVLKIDKGSILYSQSELAYDACLQMGTKILQPSLLDYID
ncbi:MAG: hypothetical protein VB078_09790 [Clostridiaceae bacterium]|nr:hypothetical protein [Clostridiaceae bacterium]